MSLNATKQDSLFLFSSFCSLLIWLGRAFLEMDFIFLGLEVIFRLGPPLASTTCMDGIYNWMSTPIKVIAQPLYLHCHPNSHGSSSSWFPQVAFSIVSPGARRHYIFLLIAFRSVCKTITVCEERTQRKKNVSLQTPRVHPWLLPKTAPEVFLITLAVRETRAWGLRPTDAAAVQTPVHFWLMKAKHLRTKKKKI